MKKLKTNKMEQTDERVNAFAQVLSRSTKQIKEDRALEIAESAEIEAKRKVEDLERELKQLHRRKKSFTDLSPDNTFGIMKVSDFEPSDFIESYSKMGLQIREAQIKLNNAKITYNELFGETFTIENIA